MRYSILDYVEYFYQLISGFRVKHERKIDDSRHFDIASLLPSEQRLRILDLANGRLYPQFMLLRKSGHWVAGIDLVNCPDFGWKNVAYRVARKIFAVGAGINAHLLDSPPLLCGDAGSLPFADGFFDMVTSVAAFEHFLEVDRIVAEVKRVLRPGGVVWVRIHPFTSLSGAHNVNPVRIPLNRLPKEISPWDHLYTDREIFYEPLNQWRTSAYVDVFSHYFEISKVYCAMREGESLLNQDLIKRLEIYLRDELTCRALVVVAQKLEN
jgi:SAM-dependent methyltransferase